MKAKKTSDRQIISRMNEIFNRQKQSYMANPMPSAASRIEKINHLKKALMRNSEAIVETMRKDFSCKPFVESAGEVIQVADRCKYTVRNVEKWMKPEKRKMNLAMLPGKARIIYQPLGVVGNMVPYNGPIYVACVPLITALAAGNNCMLKMPEGAPATSQLFETIISEAFSADSVAVINGGPEVAAAFSSLPFDHIVFTGSISTGRKVLKAAAENLCPVTLELGGKNPVIIDRDFPVALAAERICYGKSLNGGQVCIGPDSVLIPRGKEDEFKSAYSEVYKKFFPSLNNNPDCTGMGGAARLKRIQSIIKDAESKGASVLFLSDEKITDGTTKHAQVLISGVKDNMIAAREELFGPVLLVIPYDSLDDAIEYVNKRVYTRESPLALYYFGYKKANQKKILNETHSGGVTINDVFIHGGINDLPFGGLGHSGMGQYGGREGFLTLSKARGAVIRPRSRSAYTITRIMYPPFSSGRLEKIIRKTLHLS